MDDGKRRLEAYLADLRRGLAALPEAERDEIVAELRGHVVETAGVGASGSAVAAALERLGSPRHLAAQYVTSNALAGAAHGRAPWTIVRSLSRVAGVSLAGLSALAGCVVGYGLGLSLALAALHKPIAPDRVGLWRLGEDTYSLTLGFGEPPRGQELLGWWLVPIGLLAAAGVLWLTTGLGRWSIQTLRRRPLRPAP